MSASTASSSLLRSTRSTRSNQFKRGDSIELMRWSLKAAAPRYALYHWEAHPDLNQRGRILRTEGGDEHILIVTRSTGKPAFMVRVEQGAYEVHEAHYPDRLLGRHATLGEALGAVMGTPHVHPV